MAYKGIAWCYSTKIRAGNFMCTVIEINIDILQLADSSSTGREPAKLIYRLLLHTEIKNPLDKKSSSSLS